MMKKAIALIAFCILLPRLFSQTATIPDKKSHINKNMALEFMSGYSVVLGNYGSTDTNNNKSGFAGNGWLAQITFDWMGKRNFGLAFQYTYQQNRLKDQAKNYTPFPGTGGLGTGSWSNHYFMAGPVFMKTFNKFSLDLKLLAGVILSSSSNFDVPEIMDSVNTRTVHGLGTGFAYQFSAGAGYTISSHFTLKFNLGILGGWPGMEKQFGSKFIGFEEVIDPVTFVKYYIPVYSAPVEYTVKKVVTTLNPSLAVIFRF